ncbi:MAG TPA: radical SAM protein [Candidatus Ozemobacteraceae bacterium]|nr:radical SAM protein [Candidatus Ozemobacteraceae bacterium]
MQVILIHPPSRSPQPVMPLGLACLAAYLERENIPVTIVDAWAEGLDREALSRRLARIPGPPGLVGITVMSPTAGEGFATVRTAKAARPGCRTIIGGTHPSALPVDCLQSCPELDFVAVGEGEALLLALVKELESDHPVFGSIRGLGYRQAGRVTVNGRAAPIQDLDELPFPAYHLLPMARYRMHPPYRLFRKCATLMTSRGCPYECSYCTKSVSGRSFRWQSPGRMLADMERIHTSEGIRQFHFYDDDFPLPQARIREFCRLLRHAGRRFAWSCVARVDHVDPDVLREMHLAGCWLISYGIESGCQEILDAAGKGFTVGQIRDAFGWTRAAGIRTLGYVMAGLPGETAETLEKTVRLVRELDPDFVSWSITALYPGSRLYDAYHAPATNDGESASSLSPFAHGHVELYRGEIPRQQLLERVGRAYREFYFRPAFMLRHLRSLRTLTEALSYLQTVVQYCRWRIGTGV